MNEFEKEVISRLDRILMHLEDSKRGKKRQSVVWEIKEIGRRLKKDGEIPIKVIANQLGVSVPFVYQLDKDHCYAPGDPSAEDLEEALRRYIDLNELNVYAKAVFNV